MKFITPKLGSTRPRKGFLLLPKTIGRETRWLEHAIWEERWEQDGYGGHEWTGTIWLS